MTNVSRFSVHLKNLSLVLFSSAPKVVLDEARESYDAEIVHELQSNTTDDLQQNIARISAWIQQWKSDHN